MLKPQVAKALVMTENQQNSVKSTVLHCLYLTYLCNLGQMSTLRAKISVFLIYLPNEYYNYERRYKIHPHRAHLCSSELYFLIFVISTHNPLKPEQIHYEETTTLYTQEKFHSLQRLSP